MMKAPVIWPEAAGPPASELHSLGVGTESAAVREAFAVDGAVARSPLPRSGSGRHCSYARDPGRRRKGAESRVHSA